MKKTIRLLTRKDAGIVHGLRHHGFSTASGFIVHPVVPKWSTYDDYYYNLGAFHDDQLMSVMRLDWCHDREGLEFKLNTKLLPAKIKFPAAVLVKASTIQSIRGGGFNALLRYWSFKIIENWNVQYVFGTMVKDSPRVKSLKEMGYELQPNLNGWKGYYQSDEEICVASLDFQKKKDVAYKYLKGLLGKKLKEYRLEFDPVDLVLKPRPSQNVPDVVK